MGGRSSFLTLNDANLHQFRNQIPNEAPPKSFQDSFFVARNLDLDFIWSASLCIIQDSKDDWRKEAATMASVYESSYINIASSGASDGTVGCFFDRQPSWRCQFGVSLKGEEHFYECSPRKRVEILRSFGPLDREGMPLHSRAWVLQKRLLAPRSVQLGSTQVFWECHGHKNCETDSQPNIFGSDQFRKLVDQYR